MNIKRMTVSFETNDLPATLRFYQDYLGFSVSGKWPEENPVWAELQNAEHAIMFSERNAHSQHAEMVFTGSLYFNCDEVDAMWERLREVARVEYPIDDFDYGMREFAIYDPNGYLLRFGREIE